MLGVDVDELDHVGEPVGLQRRDQPVPRLQPLDDLAPGQLGHLEPVDHFDGTGVDPHRQAILMRRLRRLFEHTLTLHPPADNLAVIHRRKPRSI
jgi:hypothetical protein